MESPDPLKEINAFRAEVALGVRSPQEIAARRGRDYDEVVDEIAEAKTKAESKGGLPIRLPDTRKSFDLQSQLGTKPPL